MGNLSHSLDGHVPDLLQDNSSNQILLIYHSQYGISNGNLSRCNTGLEETANTTVIKITCCWSVTWFPAFLKLRRNIFNPLVPGTYQPYQNGCETETLINVSQDHLPYFVKKYHLCAKICCLHSQGRRIVPSKTWNLPTRLQGFTLQKILIIRQKLHYS